MSWIKRNIYFVVGGAIAVALLGMAGYYCYSNWQLNNESLQKLDEAYNDWETIINANPNSGNENINNIALARDHDKKVRANIEEVRKYFMPIPPIPDAANNPEAKDNFVSAFRSSLRRTIDQLQRDAAKRGIALGQPNFNFSFKVLKDQFNFPAGSLGPLSIQLGEVKTICDVLFHARINSLDGLQRERVSPDDFGVNAPPQDYLDPTLISVTNDLAVLSPYVITFRCFSSELSGVLAGFGSGFHGFVVKAVNVEPANFGPINPDMSMGGTPGFPGPSPGMMGAPGVPPPLAGPRGGLPVVLDEKPMKVVLVLEVVKLLPKK